MARRDDDDMDLLSCYNHDYRVWYFRDYECSACLEEKKVERLVAAERKKNAQLRKDIRLLKYELQEERTLHKGTQLDAAEYLAQKKLVNDLVKDRVK